MRCWSAQRWAWQVPLQKHSALHWPKEGGCCDPYWRLWCRACSRLVPVCEMLRTVQLPGCVNTAAMQTSRCAAVKVMPTLRCDRPLSAP